MRNTFGFTLVSLIVTLGVILVLAGSIFVAVNPAGRIATARDTRRQQDLVVLAKALKDYSLNHQGQLPFTGEISNRKRVLCSDTTRLTCGADADACLEIDTTTDFLDSYLPTLPIDPSKTNAADSGYYLEGDPSTGQITLGACNYEQAEVTQAARIKATVLDCGTVGIAYNDSCWYSLTSAVSSVNCNYVCGSGFGLSCDNSVVPTTTTCELNRLFGTHTCTACTDTTAYGDYAYSPGVANSGVTNCVEDRDSNICSGSTSVNYRPICPCY